MADERRELRDFKRLVWHRLPMRKYLCGHNVIFDIVSIVIQEWPVEAIDESKSGETVEVHALEELTISCKRHLVLTYGEDYWGVWSSNLRPLIWQVCWIVLQWYRHTPENSFRLVRWRSKWRHRKG